MSEVVLAAIVSAGLGGLGGAFGAWGAVRYEMGATRQDSRHAKELAKDAHRRIDDINHRAA